MRATDRGDVKAAARLLELCLGRRHPQLTLGALCCRRLRRL